MRKLWLITKEDFINLMKNPMWIFFAVAFPILMVTVLGFMMKDGYGNGYSSYDYYGITLMVYSILMSGMTASNAFMEERIKKPNMRIIYAPGSISSIYISKILACFFFSLLFHIVDFAFICAVFKIHIGSVAQIMLLFAVLEFFSVTVGIMMCCIFKTEATANQILSIIINLLAMFSGVFFSLDGLGEGVRKITGVLPVKYLINTIFKMVYDHEFSRFFPALGILLFASVVMLGICAITFRKEDCIC